MNDHVDIGLIAAFREGLLEPAAGDRVGRHLSGCAACAQRQAALEQVTARLAEAPSPRLPPELGRRLDAALAAEIADCEAVMDIGDGRRPRARRANRPARERVGRERAWHRPAGREPAGHGLGSRERSGRQRPSRGVMATALRPLAAAASVCLLAGGGYLLVRSVTQNSPGAPSSAAAAGKQRAKSGAALAPRVPMSGQPSRSAEAFTIVGSGTNYLPPQLRVQALSVAQRYGGTVPSAGKTGEMPMQPSRANPSLPGCLHRVTGGQQPLLVDMARYDGRSAIVIIATESGDAVGRLWVVGMGCSSADGEVITTSRP